MQSTSGVDSVDGCGLDLAPKLEMGDEYSRQDDGKHELSYAAAEVSARLADGFPLKVLGSSYSKTKALVSLSDAHASHRSICKRKLFKLSLQTAVGV